MNLIVHEAARAELLGAVESYSLISPSLGTAFTRLVEGALSSIQQSPQMFARLETTRLPGEIRRFLLTPRFPYLIIYEAHSDYVEVLAIAHASREPDYWASRRNG